MELDTKAGTVRCSRLGLAVLCPASTLPDAISLDGASEAADLGSCVHAWMAKKILGHDLDPRDHAAGWGVDADEASRLCWWAWKAWDSMSDWFPCARVEVPMAHGLLTGTADVLASPEHCDGELRVADHKSGRLDSDHSDQIKGYAWLGLQQYREAKSAYGVVINARLGIVDRERWTRAELQDWYGRTIERLQRRHTYSPGAHCRHCPRGLSCEAKQQLLKSAADWLNANCTEELPAERRGQFMADVIDRVKLVEDACNMLRSVIKADVASLGGRVETDDGRALCIESSKRKTIDYANGWPILVDSNIPTEQLCAAVSISKTKIEDAVKATAGRGQKGAAVDALMDRLAEANAIQVKTVERLEVRRSLKKVEAAT